MFSMPITRKEITQEIITLKTIVLLEWTKLPLTDQAMSFYHRAYT